MEADIVEALLVLSGVWDVGLRIWTLRFQGHRDLLTSQVVLGRPFSTDRKPNP